MQLDDGEKELKTNGKSADWVKFMFSLPFDTIPGKNFLIAAAIFICLPKFFRELLK